VGIWWVMSNVEAISTSSDSSYSWARAFRDIGVQAINNGKFPLFCMFIITLVFLFRLPTETLSQLSMEVFQNLKEYVFSGYFLFFITLIIVALYIKAFRKRYTAQIQKQNTIIEQLKNDLRNNSISNAATGES
jgi:hypothetical protein